MHVHSHKVYLHTKPLLQAVLALRSVHIDTTTLYNQLGCQRVGQTIRSNDLLSHYEEQGLTFDDFCVVYTELRYAQVSSEVGIGSLLAGLAYLTTPLLWLSGELEEYSFIINTTYTCMCI